MKCQKLFSRKNIIILSSAEFVQRVVKIVYEGPAKSFVTGFGLLQCYVLSNTFLLQTFEVFPLY